MSDGEPDVWRIAIATRPEEEDALVEALGAIGYDAVEIAGEGDDLEVRVYVDPAARAGVEAEIRSWDLGTIAGAQPVSRGGWAAWIEPVRVGPALLLPDGAPLEAGSICVRLQAGMGFGHGEHASTRLAIELLLRAVPPARTVLDVGCGTGVLALVAAARGASRVVALDRVEEARRAARANVAANAAHAVEVIDGELASVDERFELVVANILAPVLVAEADALVARACLAGGRVLLSGIVATDLARVCSAYAPWRVVDRADEDGWCAVLLAV